MADLVEAMGIASARIYAAFCSKEDLFREAIALYESGDGNFAAEAFETEPHGRAALETMLRAAVDLYTRNGLPKGCMVVLSATNCSTGHDDIQSWLAGHRRDRVRSIVERLQLARAKGELRPDCDVEVLGEFYATFLHGLSVQARDGSPRKRLLDMIPGALSLFDAAASVPRNPTTGPEEALPCPVKSRSARASPHVRSRPRPRGS